MFGLRKRVKELELKHQDLVEAYKLVHDILVNHNESIKYISSVITDVGKEEGTCSHQSQE